MITHGPQTLDDTKAASVQTTADRTAEPGGGSDRAPARDGLVAPPGLLTHHARSKPPPVLDIDLQDSVITDLHFSMDIGTPRPHYLAYRVEHFRYVLEELLRERVALGLAL